MKNSTIKKTAIALTGLAMSFGAALSPAYAADETANFDVTLTIVANCTISASLHDFGQNTGNIAADIDTSSEVTVNCTNGSPYTVALSDGGNSVVPGQRNMQNAADLSTVSYQLYSDPLRTQTWGSTTGVDTVAGTGNDADQTLTVYGRVAAGQNGVTVGDYNDTVVATVTF